MGSTARYGARDYAPPPPRQPLVSVAGVVWRLIASLVITGFVGIVQFATSTGGTLVLGSHAKDQFQNSDQAYVGYATLGRIFQGADHLLWAVAVVLLAMLWVPVVLRLVRAAAAAAVLVAVMLMPLHPAEAYYSKTDYADPFFILPSESAFFIPDVGANKDSQGGFGSEQYLNENKIAAKRYDVKHVKLPATGGYFESDYYVPVGRLIILDRTPISREWVAAAHRGTSDKDQSFPCQTSEGLDYKVGVAISAFVTEANAAKFLYWFGVNPPAGDRTKAEVIFTSVYYARSLAQVMDTVVRSKVQALVCDEVVKRPMVKANAEMAAMMAAIQAAVTGYLDSRGISLDFIGWADTVNFDHAVQDALNRRFVADQDAAIATALGDKVNTIQAVATAEATRTLAHKWNGAVPTNMSLWWLPEGISNFFTGMLKAPVK